MQKKRADVQGAEQFIDHVYGTQYASFYDGELYRENAKHERNRKRSLR